MFFASRLRYRIQAAEVKKQRVVAARFTWTWCLGAAVFTAFVAAGCRGSNQRDGQTAPEQSAVTFTRDIAPIVFENCSGCHRPGQPGPFSLLDYADVRVHSRRIAEVTRSRAMPPWLPENGYGDFADVRRLRDNEINAFQRWVSEGTPEGNSSDLPPQPTWPEGWQSGTPDLIVNMPAPYTLRPGSSDVFRNFVIPVPLPSTRYVRGVELRPGSAHIHHAVLAFDLTQMSRKLDAADPEPGYDGMLSDGVASPRGHIIGWTPGKTPVMEPPDMAWPLEVGSDLVIQMHLLSDEQPQRVQVSVGFYFASGPPTRFPFMIKLSSRAIDIPAEQSDYVVSDTYTLPADVDVLSIYPHAHYLAKDIKGLATLPDGSRKWLLWIRQWDFRWQDQYRYASPVFLSKGTTVAMRYTYDNSAANPRNPNRPPKRVVYGPHSSDEMADLWVQVLPRAAAEYDVLAADVARRALDAEIAGAEQQLRDSPGDASLHNFLGARYLQTGRVQDAIAHLGVALRLKPDYAEAYGNLGTALQAQGMLPEAVANLDRAARLSPNDDQIRLNLANALRASGRTDEAIVHLREAVRLRPDAGEAHNSLGAALASRGNLGEAARHFKRAVDIDPRNADALNNLGLALGMQGKLDEAIADVQHALQIRPGFMDAQKNLALLLKQKQSQSGVR